MQTKGLRVFSSAWISKYSEFSIELQNAIIFPLNALENKATDIISKHQYLRFIFIVSAATTIFKPLSWKKEVSGPTSNHVNVKYKMNQEQTLPVRRASSH